MYYEQDDNNWYAVFVVTGDEDNVKRRLEYWFQDKFKVFVPKRLLRERKGGIWSDNVRILFPGYVLLKGNIDIEKYYQLKNIPGLLKLLGNGCEPLKIDQQEIEIIYRLAGNDEMIGFSKVMIENGKVIVMDGPLLDMEGYILHIDYRKGRAKVRLDFLGEERTVELGISVLQPA